MMGSLETLSRLETVSRQYFHCLGLGLGLEGQCLGLGLGLEGWCLGLGLALTVLTRQFKTLGRLTTTCHKYCQLHQPSQRCSNFNKNRDRYRPSIILVTSVKLHFHSLVRSRTEMTMLHYII